MTRSRAHRYFVARHGCVVHWNGRLYLFDEPQSQAAHVRYLGTCGMGMKPSDEFCVPLCDVCHRWQHAFGNEREWWRIQGIDPAKIARELVERSPHVEAENAV